MKDVTFVWKEKEYRVEAREVLPLIAKVEEVLTLAEMYNAAQKETLPLAKLSMAFGVALRYAGANVKDDEVYSGMFNPDDKMAAFVAMNTLLSIMVPPEHLQEKSDGEPKKKAAASGGGSTSKKHSKRV